MHRYHQRSSQLSAIAVGVLLMSSAYAQEWKAPRTADGQPDLQGNWTNATLTPFERPAQYGERRAMSDAEADKIEHADATDLEQQTKPTDPKLGISDLPRIAVAASRV